VCAVLVSVLLAGLQPGAVALFVTCNGEVRTTRQDFVIDSPTPPAIVASPPFGAAFVNCEFRTSIVFRVAGATAPPVNDVSFIFQNCTFADTIWIPFASSSVQYSDCTFRTAASSTLALSATTAIIERSLALDSAVVSNALINSTTIVRLCEFRNALTITGSGVNATFDIDSNNITGVFALTLQSNFCNMTMMVRNNNIVFKQTMLTINSAAMNNATSIVIESNNGFAAGYTAPCAWWFAAPLANVLPRISLARNFINMTRRDRSGYATHVILSVQVVGNPTPGFFLNIADNEYVVSPADLYLRSISSERSVDNGAFLENQINHIGSRFPTMSVSVDANSVVGNLRLSGITASGLTITRLAPGRCAKAEYSVVNSNFTGLVDITLPCAASFEASGNVFDRLQLGYEGTLWSNCSLVAVEHNVFRGVGTQFELGRSLLASAFVTISHNTFQLPANPSTAIVLGQIMQLINRSIVVMNNNTVTAAVDAVFLAVDSDILDGTQVFICGNVINATSGTISLLSFPSGVLDATTRIEFCHASSPNIFTTTKADFSRYLFSKLYGYKLSASVLARALSGVRTSFQVWLYGDVSMEALGAEMLLEDFEVGMLIVGSYWRAPFSCGRNNSFIALRNGRITGAGSQLGPDARTLLVDNVTFTGSHFTLGTGMCDATSNNMVLITRCTFVDTISSTDYQSMNASKLVIRDCDFLGGVSSRTWISPGTVTAIGTLPSSIELYDSRFYGGYTAIGVYSGTVTGSTEATRPSLVVIVRNVTMNGTVLAASIRGDGLSPTALIVDRVSYSELVQNSQALPVAFIWPLRAGNDSIALDRINMSVVKNVIGDTSLSGATQGGQAAVSISNSALRGGGQISPVGVSLSGRTGSIQLRLACVSVAGVPITNPSGIPTGGGSGVINVTLNPAACEECPMDAFCPNLMAARCPLPSVRTAARNSQGACECLCNGAPLAIVDDPSMATLQAAIAKRRGERQRTLDDVTPPGCVRAMPVGLHTLSETVSPSRTATSSTSHSHGAAATRTVSADYETPRADNRTHAPTVQRAPTSTPPPTAAPPATPAPSSNVTAVNHTASPTAMSTGPSNSSAAPTPSANEDPRTPMNISVSGGPSGSNEAANVLMTAGFSDRVAIATLAAATTSAVLVSIAGPVASARASRVGAVAQLARCLDDGPPDPEPSPSLLELPFLITIGSSPLKQISGPVLVAAIVQTILLAAHYVLFFKTSASRTAIQWTSGLAAPIWLAYFSPTISGYAAMLLVARAGDADAVDKAIGVVAMAVVLATLASVAFTTHVQVPRHVTMGQCDKDGAEDVTKPCFVNRAQPVSTAFTECFGAWFDGARDIATTMPRAYVFIDLFVAVASAFLAALEPGNVAVCHGVSALLVVLAVAYLWYFGFVRPFRSRLETAFSLINGLLQLALSAVLTIAVFKGDRSLMPVAGWCIVLLSMMFFGQAVMLAAWAVLKSHVRCAAPSDTAGDKTADAEAPLLVHPTRAAAAGQAVEMHSNPLLAVRGSGCEEVAR
jgi:hypothetical protein